MDNQEQSVKDLFGEALDLPPEQRSSFLDRACEGTPEIRSRVEELLLQDQRLGSFLGAPLFPADSRPSPLAVTSSIKCDPATGTRLGRYSIVESLGAGGMGVVYRAHDEKLERAVAIKVLTPGVFSGNEARRRFHKEARALARLSHSHIAAIYDVGEQDGIDYIVMECVPGESLASRLNLGPLSVKEATSIILQTAEALEEAHEQGIIHRDLKPANIMVTPKGQVKVLDFGIAKLLASQATDVTISMDTLGMVGTPLYMSPEQAQEKSVDARTDLWSLGVIYYESLTGSAPFRAASNIAVLRAITEKSVTPARQLRPDIPPSAEAIISHALEKDPACRYQTASEMAQDSAALLAKFTTNSRSDDRPVKRMSRMIMVTAAIAILLALGTSIRFYDRYSKRLWAREQAIPQIASLLAAGKPLAAFLTLEQAEKYLPSDPQLKRIADDSTTIASITSSPTHATVDVQDYLSEGSWHKLGLTPLENIRMPKGYFRWKIAKAGTGELVAAPLLERTMNFALDASVSGPTRMVLSPGGQWADYIGFVGWVGPYQLPPYYVDRYEVTNSEYQKFVDRGGYEKKEYWRDPFTQQGRELPWTEAMEQFRDTTGRPGPSTWAGGHYPEGEADFPVSGVSWFEASAYAAFAGKQLPVFAQWFQVAPTDFAAYVVQASNISSSGLAPVGKYNGVGPYGTYDTAGNVREWVANSVDGNLRFILGGSWKSPSYLYSSPEEASPFDRSDTNGFRCVRNLSSLPVEATQPIRRTERDFSSFKPASDEVFKAYELLYAYPKSPLNVKLDGVVKETVDWREEKVTFDAGYRGERMSAYLFLPKSVRPPYQTVLFFPSARVIFLPDSRNGRELGDINFFDYIIQSGRAVMYPIYQDTYERRVKSFLPNGSESIELTTDRYKDAARSLDYLATRSDIDSGRLAYLGVSMGSAEGVIVSTLLQDRLKTAIFLDGGYFLDPPPPGGDQADFAPRMKKPVLMVNGRYDFTFSVDKAQNPLFAMLGSPEADKRHVLLDTPHDVTQQRAELTRIVLGWLDRYLGRVND